MYKYESITSTLKPILYFTKLFGLTPFNTNYDNLCIVTVNFAWCFLIILWNFYAQYYYLLWKYQVGIVLGKADYLAAITVLLIVVISIVKNCVARDKILKVIADLSEFDNLVKTLNLNHYEAFLNYKVRRHFFLVIVIATFTSLLIQAYFIYTNFVEINYVYYVTFLCPSFVVMQFSAICLLIKDRFALLNYQLALVTGSFNSDADFSSTVNIKLDSENIRNIVILHGKLCSITKNLNEIYSDSMLLFCILKLISIFDIIVYILRIVLYKHTVLFGYITYLAYIYTSIFALVTTSCRTKAEASKIKNFLDQIPRNENKLNLEVANFYLMFVQNKLKFTACGMFLFNEQLIDDMFSAMVTFTLILLGLEFIFTTLSYCK